MFAWEMTVIRSIYCIKGENLQKNVEIILEFIYYRTNNAMRGDIPITSAYRSQIVLGGAPNADQLQLLEF